MNRIVIADDSAMARMFTRRCLEIVGFAESEIVETENGEEALSAMKASPADLLVVDLNMPVLDGERVLECMAASPKLNAVPVLVITSADNPAKEARLKELGAFAVLGKPVSPPVLSEAMELMKSGRGV